MSLGLAYNARHLSNRRATTILTVAGVALVVSVFVASLMLSEGLRKTMGQSGAIDNVIVIRNGAQNEIQSGVLREDANIILAEPEVAKQPDGTALATKDVLVLVNLKKRSDGQRSNVNVRGVSALAREIRPGINIIAGRFPSPGTQEVMVGKAINRKFAGTDLNQGIRLVGTDWPVVGVFDAGNSAFNAEIWGDSTILMPAFRREQYSSITFKLSKAASFEAIKLRIENDKRMSLILKREQTFFAEQSENLSKFIAWVGAVISVIFSVGAIVGATITMYSAVATRTREIGILRALGFSSFSIFSAFLKESLLISFLGAILGITLASFTVLLTVTTGNFSTFAEVSFGFSITPSIVLYGILFALVMGVVGGALPAWRAAKLKIVEAFRQ